MSKLNQKELLECFDGMCLFMANHGFTERDERAVKIREMIEKKFEITEEWIEEKAMEMTDTVHGGKIFEAVDFIRSLVEEIQ